MKENREKMAGANIDIPSKDDLYTKYSDKINVNSISVLTEHEQQIKKRYLKKIDIRLVPVVMLLYLSSLIDKANIGSALVVGLSKDLNLSVTEEANTMVLFGVAYILCEFPANILLKRFKPHHWFSLIGTTWSICTIILAFVKNGTQFNIVRVVMGALEAGLSPGVIAFLPYWYTLDEIPSRMFLFFTALPVAGIVGGPLALAFTSLDINMHKYQQLFLFEGILTALVGILAFFVIVDYPETSKILTEEERALITKRLRESHGLATKARLTFTKVVRDATEWRVFPHCIMFFTMQYCNTTTIAYGPTILKQIGFSSNMSLLFTSIPSLIGLISTFLSIRLAKRIPYYLMITGNFLILLVSFAVVGFVKNATLKYIFFCVAGLSGTPNSSLIVTWSSLNVGGTSKRLITSALVVAVGSAGSMVSPLFFTRNYAPAFTIGFILMIVLPAVGIVLSLSIALYYKTTNDRRDRNPIDVSHLTEDEQVQLNDRHPSFRYKL